MDIGVPDTGNRERRSWLPPAAAIKHRFHNAPLLEAATNRGQGPFDPLTLPLLFPPCRQPGATTPVPAGAGASTSTVVCARRTSCTRAGTASATRRGG